MFNQIFATIISVIVIGPDAQYRGRSLCRVWFAMMIAIMLGLSCLSGVVNASPAPIQSVVIETTVEAAGARMMARRAAFDLLVRTACREVGAARGRVIKIYTESCDGAKYVITADVQVLSR